jgi:hypothetical protein
MESTRVYTISENALIVGAIWESCVKQRLSFSQSQFGKLLEIASIHDSTSYARLM